MPSREGLAPLTTKGPDFMVIGAQKAASTTLLASLREHPEVWMPPDEDPFLRDPLFSPDGVPGFQRRYAPRDEPLVGLKCPDYLARPEVPPRIAALVPSCRFIVILRNPVDRAISAYFWLMRWGVLPVVDPNIGLRRLLDGEYDQEPMAREVLEWGLYHRHLSHWRRHVEAERILVVHDSSLRDEPGSTLATVFEHLGVDNTFRPSSGARSRNEGMYPLARLRFAQLRNRWVLDRHESGYLNIYPPRRIGPRVWSQLVAATDRFALRPLIGNESPPIGSDLRALLAEYYRADSEALAETLGSKPVGWP